MKKTKKLISLLLFVFLLFGVFSPAVLAAEKKDYEIINPYEKVIWEGENAWGAYKGSLHTHTTFSDANVDMKDMIGEYYNQGFDFLAITDHSVTGVEWNKAPARLPLYQYQWVLGYKPKPLSDEEYYGMTSGTYPTKDGKARNFPMTCVTGGNELNNLTLTKSHVNGFFLDPKVGNGFDAGENGYEGAVAFVDKQGGLSHINHPGDWFNLNKDVNNAFDEEKLQMFADIFMKYDSCLGTEVFNEHNGTTGFDRILWDNFLMKTLPYGRNLIGFSNGDTHFLSDVDSSFSIFMMEENSTEKIKETMQSGTFFLVTRKLRSNDIIGPEKEFNAMNTDIPYPTYNSVKVQGHTLTVKVQDCNLLQWIGNGKVLMQKEITPDMYGKEISFNLDTIQNAEELLYVRCELLGDGGMNITQTFPIDDGEVLEYKAETDIIKTILYRLQSTRFYVIFDIIVEAVKGLFNK